MLTISKVLDYVALLGIVVLFAFYLFKHPSFVIVVCSLLGILALKWGAAYIKANYYEKEYKKLQKEVRDIIK